LEVRIDVRSIIAEYNPLLLAAAGVARWNGHRLDAGIMGNPISSSTLELQPDVVPYSQLSGRDDRPPLSVVKEWNVGRVWRRSRRAGRARGLVGFDHDDHFGLVVGGSLPRRIV
jgi:hypothetical protein